MSSIKSFFRKATGKPHKYETQSDLKDMTAEQIVSLNPSEVGNYIDKEPGGVPLTGAKKRAMYTLLAIKNMQKQRPNERARQSSITSFLEKEGIKSNPEVDKLISQAQYQIAQENTVKMNEQLDMKDMENRLRKLNNQQPIPDTEEETLFRRLRTLKAGKGKSRKPKKSFGKNISKRNHREKTKKRRKGSKYTVKTKRRK